MATRKSSIFEGNEAGQPVIYLVVIGVAIALIGWAVAILTVGSGNGGGESTPASVQSSDAAADEGGDPEASSAEAAQDNEHEAPAAAGEPEEYEGPPHEVLDASLAPPLDGEVHEVTLEVEEKEIEVAEGQWMNLWTFGGTVPGPVVRVKQGDMVNFTLVNNGEIGHSMDFHAAEIAPNRAYATILPGESISFQFEAKQPGVYMYHCATAPVLHHIGNGMYGMIIVEPEGPPRPPAREYFLVQSELYFGGQGEVGDLTKMQEKDADWVVFNGYANQYTAEDALVADPGELVRVYILNVGPSLWSAFHVIGTIFDWTWQEGVVGGPAQTVNIAPSQGAIVEFSMEEEGVYPFVTHAFADASIGGIGQFIVGTPAEGAGH
ncbi:MAG TPA: multicopper oxidase domain-containing protein [Dehalococcoidia bacterium]|nr:multicopper oxidase domain-containing protein [Dehalococcoidia bacterium]